MYFNWNGCCVEEFSFEGRTCYIAIPTDPSPNGSFVFKTEYWGAYPDIERRLVEEHGFYSVAIRHATRFSPEADLECEGRFIDYICEKYSLSKKCSLVGMSMGGSRAVKFAARYPERVDCIFLDAPVLSYLSYPVQRHWESCKNEFATAFPNVDRYELFDSDIHPMCGVKTLIKNRIPVFMCYGTEDQTVPYSENGKLLEDAYRDHTELLNVACVNFRGHHPHGFIVDNTPIVEFIVKNTKIKER